MLKMMYTHMNPKLRQRFAKLTWIADKNVLVCDMAQYSQELVLLSVRYPPVVSKNVAKYSPQVLPLGASNLTNSLGAQAIGAFARDVPKKPSTTYVKGLTLYMKIQKPGRSPGPARILERMSVKCTKG